MEGDSFYTLFCIKFKCPLGDFEKRVFWQCMDFQTMPLARLIRLIDRDFFEADLILIDAVKDLTSYSSVRDVINFHSIQPQKRSFLRRHLKIRMSKGRLLNLAWLLMAKPN